MLEYCAAEDGWHAAYAAGRRTLPYINFQKKAGVALGNCSNDTAPIEWSIKHRLEC